jgi:hypothetical protein
MNLKGICDQDNVSDIQLEFTPIEKANMENVSISEKKQLKYPLASCSKFEISDKSSIDS